MLGPLDAATTLSAVPTIDLSVAAYQGLLAPVTFRIYHWSISQAGNLLVGGFLDDVVLRGSTVNVASVTPVPEPSAHLLLLAGLAALAWRRHRNPPAEPGAKA